MSAYIPKDGRAFVYDFWLFGQHYKKSTGQTDRALAQKVEDDLKDRIRRQHAGVVESPRFTEWAGLYYGYVVKEQRLRRPEAIDDVLRVLLRFCGARPDGTNPHNPLVEGEPYRDLRLKDFIEDPDLILDFEEWMTKRGISATTKHHYRTYMSRMYTVAMLPQYRKLAGVKENPFAGIPRGKKVVRRVTLTVDQVVKALGAMSYHVRLALGIAALAPTLRLENILGLRWDEHIDETVRWITVDEHKTASETGEPKIAPIPEQLRTILLDAKQRAKKGSAFVVQFRGRRVSTITNGVRAGFERAGIPYGRFTKGGATFHSIRHSVSTLIPQLGINAWLHRDLMGWSDIGTAQTYTHLRPVHLVSAAETLSTALPIAEAVTAARRRPPRSPATSVGQTVGLRPATDRQRQDSLDIPRLAGRRPGRPFVRKAR